MTLCIHKTINTITRSEQIIHHQTVKRTNYSLISYAQNCATNQINFFNVKIVI